MSSMWLPWPMIRYRRRSAWGLLRRAGRWTGLSAAGCRSCVAVGGAAVPVLQGDHLADLVTDEVVGEGDAGVEALMVPTSTIRWGASRTCSSA